MDVSRARCAGCGGPMRISRCECTRCGVALEGDFQTGPLARLSEEDQTFVHAFVRHHGSIKKMEAILGVSYPTVKNRLNAITRRLDDHYRAAPSRGEVLARLADGEIDVEAALEKITRSERRRR